MAIRFEVLDDEGEPREGASLVLDGTRILIGRGPACDVRLPEVSVSLRHASIEVTGGRMQLRDERSTNGTFAGRERVRPVAPVTLEKSGVVRVGRVSLRVTSGTFAPEPEPAIASRALAYSLVAGELEARGVDVTPVVRCTLGEDEHKTWRLEEEGFAYRAGRDEEASIVLTDGDASRDQTQFTRRSGVVLVRDLGSRNGTLLGEVELSSKRDVPWKLGATLTMGHSTFVLDDPLGKTLAAIEAEPDAILPEEEAAPPAPKAPEAEEEAPASEPPKAAPRRKAQAPVAPQGEPNAEREPTRAELAILVTSLVVLGLSVLGLAAVLGR
jgi:pSer/pThr/pTyr-binding forkhead associated (FHA) protein